MTQDEFRAILNEQLLVYYPDTDVWVAGLAVDTKNRWAELFANIETTDLRTAIELIVSGQTEMPRRELLGTTLAVLSKRQRYLREEREARRSTSTSRRSDEGGILKSQWMSPVYCVMTGMIERISREVGYEPRSPGRAYVAQMVGAVVSHWFGQGLLADQMQSNITFEELETLAWEVGRAVPGDRLRTLDEIADDFKKSHVQVTTHAR